MRFGDGHLTPSAATPDQRCVLVNGPLVGTAVVKDALCHASLRYKQEGGKKKTRGGVCQSAVSRFMLGENAAPMCAQTSKRGVRVTCLLL